MPSNSETQYAVTKAIFDQLTAAKATLFTVPITDVYFGDQMKLPRTPALCVESGTYTRTLSGIGGKGRTDNTFHVFVLAYLCKVADIQLTKETVEQLSEAVMLNLHSDVKLGGLVVHSFVTQIEPGYATRGGALFRAARITWEGMTKTLIT